MSQLYYVTQALCAPHLPPIASSLGRNEHALICTVHKGAGAQHKLLTINIVTPSPVKNGNLRARACASAAGPVKTSRTPAQSHTHIDQRKCASVARLAGTLAPYCGRTVGAHNFCDYIIRHTDAQSGAPLRSWLICMCLQPTPADGRRLYATI